MKKSAAAFQGWLGRQGRWTRRGVWALTGLVAFWVVAWLSVPPLLKWQLQKQASDVLGRSVTVEQVSFRPWSLELELRGLRIAAQDVAEPQFQADRLYVDAELQSLLRLAPVLDAVQIDAPRVNIRHLGEGRYDFDDVLRRLAERPKSESDEPARFALYNLNLSGGAVRFDDQPVGAVHQLEQLTLALPFLSNLGSQREVVTQPHLAFVLNGSSFDSRAETTPFAETRATEAQLVLKDFDLTPYLAYWPANLPAKPVAGRVQANLKVDFEQHGDRPTVKLGGEFALENFKLQQGGADLLAWERLGVKLADVRPLERHIGLERVDWQGPNVWLSRTADGQTNIERLLAKLPQAAPASPNAAPNAPPNAPPNAASTPGWTVAVGEFHLQAGRVDWDDQTLRPAFVTAVEALDLRVREITWPVKAPMPLNLALRHKSGTLNVQGQATDQQAEAEVDLQGVALSDAGPYLRAVLNQPLKGQLAVRARLGWRAGEGAEAGPRVRLDELTLADVQLGSGKELPATLRQLRVSEADVQLNARRIHLGKVLIDRPQVLASRNPQGQWMVQQWLQSAASPSQPPAQKSTEAPASTPEWALGWTTIDLKDGGVRLEDRLTSRPVRLSLNNLQLGAGAWQSDAAGRTPLTLDVRVAGSSRSRADPGRLQVQGQLGWKPGTPQPDVTASARVTATALPVHAVEPYVSERLNLELLRADAGYRGQVEVGWTAAGLRLAVNGDASVDEFRANTLSPSEELLAWKALNLRGVQLALAPDQPLRLQVAETALSDWYARIAIDATGRINLQDLVKPAPGAQAAAPGSAASATPAAPAAPAQAAPAAPAPATGPAPDLRFGPVALVNGRVLFSDQFIKPNYRANLSELTGKLSAFSNQPAAGGSVDLADLELLGRVEGTASLDLRGRINPLAQPLALDVTGKVRDLELPPLSPYSAKYAGYGIERGKLSVNVAYRVTPDGQLTASNQIILNQLAFGERVEGSDAPNLPVKLAVALLADRNGVIDINLPISGSMNDPQFSVGPVIVRAVFNLIGKAITAPFALLASALGGGGEDSAQVVFAPGTARLDAEARARLDGVAKALADRPALRLTVVGRSELEAERQAYQRERVAELVRAEKRRALARTGAAADGEIAVSDEEYPVLLRAVYRRADITKPRNAIGLARDLPPADMEALLMTNVPVTEDAMRELALQRGVAVRDYLTSRQLSSERVFMGAPQGSGQGSGANAPERSAPGPRADLQLSAR